MDVLLAYRDICGASFESELGSVGLFWDSLLGRGAVLFMRRRGVTETQKQACRFSFGTQISTKWPQTL